MRKTETAIRWLLARLELANICDRFSSSVLKVRRRDTRLRQAAWIIIADFSFLRSCARLSRSWSWIYNRYFQMSHIRQLYYNIQQTINCQLFIRIPACWRLFRNSFLSVPCRLPIFTLRLLSVPLKSEKCNLLMILKFEGWNFQFDECYFFIEFEDPEQFKEIIALKNYFKLVVERRRNR